MAKQIREPVADYQSSDYDELTRLLWTQRSIDYRPVLAQVSNSVTAAVFLSQLLYWSPKGSNQLGWIWKSQEEWTQETGLTRSNQESARKKWKELGVLEERHARLEHRLYFRINFGTLNKLVTQYLASPNADFPHSEMQTPHIGDGADPAFVTYTEITTETTTENTYADAEKPEWLTLLEAEIPSVQRVKWKPRWTQRLLEWWANQDEYSAVGPAMRVARGLVAHKKGYKDYGMAFLNWIEKEQRGFQPSNNAVLTPEQRAEKYRRAAEEYADLAVVDYDEESNI